MSNRKQWESAEDAPTFERQRERRAAVGAFAKRAERAGRYSQRKRERAKEARRS